MSVVLIIKSQVNRCYLSCMLQQDTADDSLWGCSVTRKYLHV